MESKTPQKQKHAQEAEARPGRRDDHAGGLQLPQPRRGTLPDQKHNQSQEVSSLESSHPLASPAHSSRRSSAPTINSQDSQMHVAPEDDGSHSISHVGSTTSGAIDPQLGSVSSPASSPGLSSASERTPVGPYSTISRISSLPSSLLSDAGPLDLGSDYSMIARSLLSGRSDLPSSLSSDGYLYLHSRLWFDGFNSCIKRRHFLVQALG